MRCENWRHFLKDGSSGGLAGIGVSIMITLITDGMKSNPIYWVLTVGFGFLVGFLISLGNGLFLHNMRGNHHKPLILYLGISYIISTAIFYGTSYVLQKPFYRLYNIPAHVKLLYMSMGVGIVSMMIAFFFIYAEEKEEMLRLERENKELAVVEERNRIARELHDSVSQNLFGISLNLKTLDYTLEHDPVKAARIIKLLQGMVEETQTEMRLMIYELRPAALAEKGFFEALDSMINLFKVRYNLDIQSDFRGDEILDSRKQLVLYRILQESLSNTVKHAAATKVKVLLISKDGEGQLSIQDNGKGFTVSNVDASEHIGLRGMRERVEQMKGELTVESAVGNGTTVRVKL